jgi:hypothetical protein
MITWPQVTYLVAAHQDSPLCHWNERIPRWAAQNENWSRIRGYVRNR